MGLHNVSIWASSDSFPTTDTATMSTIVTDSIYGIDYDWNSDGANLGTRSYVYCNLVSNCTGDSKDWNQLLV